MPEPSTPSRPLPIPQLAGLFLLACFAAQSLYVASHAALLADEMAYASPGPQYAGHQFSKPPDPYRSPLIYHLAQFPVRHGTVPWFDFVGPRYQYRWLLRVPFVLFGILRGASLWYVARRMYGAWAGLFALALYCFSPRMVAEGSHIWPDVLAAWGFFGVIFLAIASAHTFYAARGTLTWHQRWRRPILMGIALGIAVSAQFTTWMALPLAIAFLLYLVPGRRREAAAMLVIATLIALAVVCLVYRFDFARTWDDIACFLRYSSPPDVSSRLYQDRASVPYTSPRFPIVFLAAFFEGHHRALREAVHSTNFAFLGMFGAGFVIWLISRRARWFGNTAPLIALAIVPLFSPGILWLWAPATAFFFMFLGGIFADAMEAPQRKLALATAVTLLLVDIGFGLERTLTMLSS